MKPLVCDLCGSNDVAKDGELFVCRYCGTKYTVETARNMMFGEDAIQTRTADFEIVAGKLIRYHGRSTDISIPDGTVEIAEEAFKDLGISSVTIPDSVTSIGELAFFYCTSLASVTIGNSVTSIERGAFGGCTSLRSVSVPKGATIGGNAFGSSTEVEYR